MTLEINLLPRLTPYQKYRPLIIAGIGLGLVLIVTLVFAYYFHLNSQIATAKKELDRAKSDNTVLKAERAVSKDLRLYYDIKKEAQHLRESEQDYAKILDAISAKLSEKTEVYGAYMNRENQRLELEIRAESIDVIADFAALIREESWVSNVFVDRIRSNGQNDENQDEQDEESEELQSNAYTTKVIIDLEPKKAATAKSSGGSTTK